uniref:Uncharacterized protein n=1 Tax=Heliothis virescens TaxID=7102 RepID=A0A2A4J7F4_HELVI
MLQRKKKIEMKPTLVVTKHDGEYTVQMEVFRKFSKERLLFQYPYDEKPPLVYTIGKTAEEKRKIQRQRDRRERRETRRKSRLLQSTFRDRCQEICLKAYNQAIGLLPLPHPNAPDCPCVGSNSALTPPIIDSCSCSDVGTISSSDTDNDEWVVEFTPPAARWDTKAKHPPVYASNETQYNYLDYKVKVLDKSDKDGNWVWYNTKKKTVKGTKSKSTATASTVEAKKGGKPKDATTKAKGGECKSKADGAPAASPVTAKTKPVAERKRSIVPATPTSPISSSKNAKNLEKAKKSMTHHSDKSKNPLVMSISVNYDKNRLPRMSQVDRKAYMDAKKIAKYREIIEELRAYDDIGELKPPRKTNRASNTPRKKLSPFTMQGFIDYEKKKQRSLAADRSLGFLTSSISSTFGSKYQM